MPPLTNNNLENNSFFTPEQQASFARMRDSLMIEQLDEFQSVTAFTQGNGGTFGTGGVHPSAVVGTGGIDRVYAKPKKKTMDDVLDEIADKNQSMFDNIKIVTSQLNDIKKEGVKEMMEKYDYLLFSFIGSNRTIVGKSEKTIESYLNTLIENLYYEINGFFYEFKNLTKDDFYKIFITYLQRRIELTSEKYTLAIEMAGELYDYYIKYKAKLTELEELTCSTEKINTVCEQYLDNDLVRRSNEIRRFEENSIIMPQPSTRIIGSTAIRNEFRPF